MKPMDVFMMAAVSLILIGGYLVNGVTGLGCMMIVTGIGAVIVSPLYSDMRNGL